jgi:hypothetical protein
MSIFDYFGMLLCVFCHCSLRSMSSQIKIQFYVHHHVGLHRKLSCVILWVAVYKNALGVYVFRVVKNI